MAKNEVAVITDLGEKIGGARKDVAVKGGPRPQRTDPADTRPGWAKRFVAAENIGYDKKPTGKWGLLDTRSKSKWGGYRSASRVEFESQAAAERAIPLIAVSQKHYVRETYAKGADGKYDSSKSTYEVWRKVSDKKTVKAVAQSFPSREAALAHMASQAESLLGTAKGYGEEILAKPERVVRTGPAWRKGDVNPEAFVKEIGARGVEFGNWQGDRQAIVNHAYDAMKDLADITGVKPESLTLDNKLAIAFGARGNGGKRSARAHYEPKRAAINLTKESGAGTLAHEWWHAADHYLAQVDDPKLGEMTVDKDGTKILPNATDDSRIFGSHRVAGAIRPGNLSEPVKQAYKDLMDTMFNKPMEVSVDKPAYDAKLARAKDSLKSELDRLRGEIAKPAPYGKRNVAAATPAQLAKFDAVVERLLAGTLADLETKYTYNNTDIALGSRGSMAGRWSNATLDELSGVYKDVRGRSGFDSQHGRGVMDTVRHRMSEVKTAMTLAEDAAKSATRTVMGRTDFAKNAVKLDQSRTTPYWQTRHEMAARAFTSFIEDKLAAAGRKSDYLSYGSDNALYKVFDEALPFPEGPERAAINAKFEALFDAMKQADVVKASAPSPANMLSAMSKGSADGQQTMVTGQSGKPNPGWSDAARAKSAEVRAADAPAAQWPDAAKYRTLPNGDRMVTKEFADAMRREAMALPKTDPTRSLKIEHAQIIEGTAWRPDGTAYSPKLLEASRQEVTRQQEAARAQTTRGRREAKKVAEAKPRAVAVGDNGAPPDTQLKAAKRLEEVAKRTIAEAEKTINQPRQMNTARRARLGGGVIEEAQRRVALSKTALKIAAALRDGTASPELAKISSLADIDRLDREYRQAMYSADRAKNLSYGESRSGMRGGEPTIEDVAHAKSSAGVRANLPSSSDFPMLRTALKNQGVARELAHLEKLAAKSQHWHTDAKDVAAVEKVAKAIKAIKDKPTTWAQHRWQPKSLQYDANNWLKSITEYNGQKRLGLGDTPALQSMLKSYADVRESKAKIDPVVAAERALIGSKIPGFFPTPQSLAARMADLADIRSGMTVLEPSAGTGRLADAVAQRGAKVEAVETASSLRDILTKKGHNIIGSDFNEVPIAQRYDRVVMNPPFEKGQDIAHVRRAYDMLKPGGKMVAIMGEGGFFRSDKQAVGFREWLSEVGGQAEKLPEGTFKESNTGVNTRLVTITKPGVNPGWSDAARLASAEVRAANAADMGKPMSAAMQRALETSQAKAAPAPSTLAAPAPAPAETPAPSRAVSRQEFMAQAEVRAHPDGGHEVRGPGTNGQWVRTNATGTATAAKMVAFANHVGRAANKLGAIAMIAAPVTAAALAYDATRNQAAADGLSPTQQTTQALGSAAAAGLATAGIGYGIMKGLGALAKASPKIIGRALPGVGLGLMAYGAYQGGKRHGWKGVVLGSVGADGLLDLGADQVPQINASLPAPASPGTAQNFEVANDAFNAMQETAASERILRGFQNPTNLVAALAAQGKELGRPRP